MPRASLLYVAAFALLAASCRTPAPPAAIDPALSSRVPPAAIALAGVNLDKLRASSLFAKLPASLESFRAAHYALIASTGAQLLTITKAAEIALLGPPDLIAAANAPHPPAAILGEAEPAAHHPIWIVIRGGAPLPLEGNLANANNLIVLAESVTLTAELRETVDLELTARCPSPTAALQFEQRLRALISISAAASKRQSEAAAIQLRRDDRTVHATLSIDPGALSLLLP